VIPPDTTLATHTSAQQGARRQREDAPRRAAPTGHWFRWRGIGHARYKCKPDLIGDVNLRTTTR
jgi:hypothetical protein